MTGGLTTTFHARPVDSGKPTYLSDLEPDEQRRRIVRILQDNEENGAFHFALPRSNDAGAVERLLEVTQMVPLVLFSTPAAGQCAFQPLSESPLTADVAAGLYPTLSYFIYLVESFAPNKDVAQAFLRFLKGGGAEQEAARVHQSYSFVLWRDGLAEFERRGGWDGELLRLHSYAGYSRGWDEPTELDVGGPRPYHHFVGPDATFTSSSCASSTSSTARSQRRAPRSRCSSTSWARPSRSPTIRRRRSTTSWPSRLSSPSSARVP